MYDTIELISPFISDDLSYNVINKTNLTQRIDIETGEVLFEIVRGELEGSYDSRLSIVVRHGRIKIGGSVHKFILGHNCLGGPTDIKKCCRYLVYLVKQISNIELPVWEEWIINRVDVAHVFDLGDIDEVKEVIRMMRGCTFPRREPKNYGLTGHYFAGASTTVKFYNKGPEFRKHDKPRLIALQEKGYFIDENVNMMEKLSDRLMRVEVEVRKRKMKYDRIDLHCGGLDDGYFAKLYSDEVAKVYNEGLSDMEVVREINDVKKRLDDCYSKRKANALFGVWSRLQVEGIEKVKSAVSRKTWYRYRHDLTSVGVSLYGGLVYEEKKWMPALNFTRARDFLPYEGEKYHIAGKFINVDEVLDKIAM